MSLPRTLIWASLIVLTAACSGDSSEPNETASGGAGSSASSSSSGSASGANTGGAADPAATLPDPCTLVTKDEASAAMGGIAAEGSSDLISRPGMPTGRSCSYRATSGPGAVQLTIWSVSDELAAAYKEQARGFGDVNDIAGVGDSAYRVGWPQLVVRKDDYLLDLAVELVKYHPDTAQAALKTMATTSIGRLTP
jgi:hypothetical protein